MYVEQRREEILNHLNKSGDVSVATLSELLGVSQTTIRSDLTYLEEKNKLRRTHGGAIINKKIGEYKTITEKRIVNIDKKELIAKKAVNLIEENDTIALDSGTTCYELSKQLTKFKNLNLIINDFSIAQYLSENTNFKLIFIGGLIGRDINSTNGPLALNLLENINCDKVFMACESFDFKKGFSTYDENQAAYKKKLMNTANTKIMLIDSYKFNKVSSFSFSTLDDYDYLISENLDEQTSEEISKYTKII